ncbi:MAG: GTP 3',8-cyclase MoaA [Geothrix sp.]|uniref:GTP 3',8-cyclase MoaA n=1 Tax=Geothrix sp. TaxID=1962974 RepID=UPI0017AE3C09|nr:GTP 3',8-cyclase MoaA [Geothrix sp.]NWJ42045.1 GTP 3',8-cyclase MoaA [Geothrix sp.]WIL19987.1 MAG: GTP 3',8-cyclase MoaA [Geothrix sp.]
MSPLFATPPENHLPRMLRVKDGLKDGLGRGITYLRVSVTEQCNLACVYCKPRTGVAERRQPPAMSRNEVVQLVKVFTSLGIRKVRLTGGEPLLRRDLETIIAGISPEVEGRVHLTTNGLHLARKARALRDAGLAGVNVSLDAADAATFARLTGKNQLGKVLAGLEAARSVGLKTKLNAVVLRGWNEDQILPLTRLAQQGGFQVRFIEFMPYQGNGWGQDQFMPAAEILRTIQEGLGSELEEEPVLGLEEGPARLFRIPGSTGKVGVISTLSADFCDRCNRVRLTSQGALKACLFGNQPVDLLEPLRNHATHDDLVRLIRQALTEKLDCHPMRTGGQPTLGQGMWQVGG